MRSQKSEVRYPLTSGLRPLALGGQRGIALVITLVLLSVITFMTITFLVLSRRERGAVSTATDQNTAKFAADTAFSRATAELLAPMLAMTNDQQMDLLVSRNFINRNGFDPAALDGRTNVNYDYTVSGAQLNQFQYEQNLTNLVYNPRPPVFVTTNSAFPSEFRFYLDLNRNGRFDTNGLLPVSSGNPAFPWYDTNGNPIAVFNPPNILSNMVTGDPEWIGVLEFPDRPHGPNNRFIARYAYIVAPSAKTLDVNSMHNQSVTRTLNSGNDGYLRNQGVGTWELNLAAFLSDLNTNLWDNGLNPYVYRRAGGLINQGMGFEDALALLAYRYNYSYSTLSAASALFPGSAAALANDDIDEYSDGLTMTGTSFNESSQVDQVNEPWAGADNANHFFTPQDFFDRSKVRGAPLAYTTPTFVDRLTQAGTSNDTYNAYTYYRMLAQLGTDSEPDDRINVNYRNVSNNVVVPGLETNLIPWKPLEFFTNAAQAMFRQLNLRDMNGDLITITNIPLYPTNYYTPSVHRILQLAANIFDATTNQTVPLIAGQTNAFAPSVFRPVFSTRTIGAVKWAYISGYVEETTSLGANAGVNLPYADIGYFANNNPTSPRTDLNLWGVPWVVGAKKGFPNFNYNAVKPSIALTRKIQLSRAKNGDPLTVKQMFNIGISNQTVIEAWNSYGSAWPATRQLRFLVTNEFIVHLVYRTNIPNSDLVQPDVRYIGTDFLTNTIGRYTNAFPGRSMVLLEQTNYPILGGPISYAYYSSVPAFRQGTNFENTFQLMPQWYVVITNRIHYAMIDQALNRVVDYVNVDMSQTYDLTYAITNGVTCTTPPYNWNSVWCTDLQTGTPFLPWSYLAPGTVLSRGLDSQIAISLGANTGVYTPTNTALRLWIYNRSNPAGTNQIEYNPTFGTNLITCLQANDPLVHYTVPDLTYTGQDPTRVVFPPTKENQSYRPWGGNPNNTDDETDRNLNFKDPLVLRSDAWDFPTNKLPNIGWLGRIHRGTPWQTIYAKAVSGDSTNFNNWLRWSGHTNIWPSGSDSIFSMPPNDHNLFDLFTATPNQNASRGRLNVNQTNLAAWSAVLSGVLVITNFPNSTITGWTTIEPAGVYDPANPPPLVQIWTNINGVRANLNFSNGPVFAGQSFHSVGDVLAAPALTTLSPFLTNALPPNLPNTAINVDDAVLERIPQQIMSLLSLSHEPRFVVYSFGQTLHPAEHSLVTGGQFNGLCTNYQITAETATRAVVRAVPIAVTNGNVISTNFNLVVEQYNVLPPD